MFILAITRLQVQGIVAPEGIIVDFYSPMTGRRHDSHVPVSSRFNERLANAQVGRDIKNKYYTDRGYYTTNHGYAAYTRLLHHKPWLRSLHRGRDLCQLLIDENTIMAKRRVYIERTFGNIANQWAYIDFHKRHKILINFIKKYYWLAALLNYCRTCVSGSGPATTYWPTLSKYFRKDDIPY